jgi:hypothetical protein
MAPPVTRLIARLWLIAAALCLALDSLNAGDGAAPAGRP